MAFTMLESCWSTAFFPLHEAWRALPPLAHVSGITCEPRNFSWLALSPACASDSGASPGVSARIAPVRARELGPQQRVPCGAKRRRDGKPCQALSVPGRHRCKWHGGASTGPKTPEGEGSRTGESSARRREPLTEGQKSSNSLWGGLAQQTVRARPMLDHLQSENTRPEGSQLWE